MVLKQKPAVPAEKNGKLVHNLNVFIGYVSHSKLGEKPLKLVIDAVHAANIASKNKNYKKIASDLERALEYMKLELGNTKKAQKMIGIATSLLDMCYEKLARKAFEITDKDSFEDFRHLALEVSGIRDETKKNRLQNELTGHSWKHFKQNF